MKIQLVVAPSTIASTLRSARSGLNSHYTRRVDVRPRHLLDEVAGRVKGREAERGLKEAEDEGHPVRPAGGIGEGRKDLLGLLVAVRARQANDAGNDEADDAPRSCEAVNGGERAHTKDVEEEGDSRNREEEKEELPRLEGKVGVPEGNEAA